MRIDENLINYLEELSSLTLSAEEKQRIAGDLEEVLGYIKRLEEADTAGVLPRSHPFDNVNAFREDETGAPFNRGLILKNAPEKNDMAFIAPKTVE